MASAPYLKHKRLSDAAWAANAIMLLALSGCSASDGSPMSFDGSLTGAMNELAEPGSTLKNRQKADDAKCREFGFTPGTDGYGNCRLQLEQIRATNNAAAIQARAARNAQARTETTTTSYIDAHTGQLTTCSGSGAAKTCF
jgi:hypothetical protein